MIAVDSSALLAIVFGEAKADACIKVLTNEPDVMVSAGTAAEALIVACRCNVGEEMTRLLEELGLEIVTVTSATARRIGQAYAQWGKGVHPAGLNFGDCFAYAVAKEHSCPLLFLGDDFSKTDVERVL